MKRILLISVAALLTISAAAQTPKNVKYTFTEATDLNLIGKLMDTPNPYHRVDTCRFKGFTKGENEQVRCSAGLAVLFRTNSSTISVKSEFGYMNHGENTMGIALRGYDLYIKNADGEWVYAASKADGRDRGNCVLIKDMDRTEKDCMLYLPIYSEEYSVKIGVEEGAAIEALESPFRHRVAIFGSSFTQGISISRPGMSYPMQFMRNTGIQLLSLGCSGNCKMQPYFADVLMAAEDIDAMIFDAFSNPGAQMIEDRLFPFIEKIQAAKPGIPLIFMQTIYRESRNFNKSNDKAEQAKQDMAAKLMAEAVKKYDNVYFIQTNASDPSKDTSVDGTHPSDWGYMYWAKSIEKPVLKILKKYGLE